jgi:hypothetical protein
VTLRGGCLCGAVTFEIDPPHFRFVRCYCSRCRKATGAGCAANLFVAPSQLRWLAGSESVARFDLPQARSFATSFCRRCGSPMPHATRSGREVVVPAGAIESGLFDGPAFRAHWNSRAEWIVERDGELPDLS